MKLGQAAIGKALEACQSELEAEEVLSAYIVNKYQRGSTSPGVLRKIHLLAMYLTVTERGHLVDRYNLVFQVLRSEISAGGGRIGCCPALTPAGKTLFNQLRRSKSSGRIVTDTVDCGPRPVDGFLTPKQSAPYRHAALFHDAWIDQWISARPRNTGPSPEYEGPSPLPSYNMSQLDPNQPLLRSWDVPPPGSPESDD